MKSFLKKSLIFLVLFTMLFQVLPSNALAADIPLPDMPDLVDMLPTAASWTIYPVMQAILFATMKLAQVGIGLSGMLLNWIIDKTIINLHQTIGVQGTTGGLEGITVAWRVIRDLINMSFIFLLIYEGIKVIFGNGNAKKVVTGIITAALLINFSMFFTKVIIDASNIVTVSLYDAIDVSGTQNTSGGTVSKTLSTGFANSFMQALGITGFFDSKTIASSNFISDTNTIVIYAGATIFMLIATFVFLAISVMFIIRYLAFIILIILSPVGFVFGGVPGLSKLSDDFWKTLWGQVIFAPLYMLMTWIVLTIIGSDGFLLKSSSSNLGKAFLEPGVDNIGLILNFIMVIFLLVFTLTTSKKYATQGGIITSKWIGAGTALAGGAIFGGSAWLGRTTLGRMGNAVSESQTLKDLSVNKDKSAFTRFFAKQALVRGEKTAKSSFDFRNTKAGSTVGKQLDLELGKGVLFNQEAGKGGFRGTLERKIKEGGIIREGTEDAQKFAESLKYSAEEARKAREELNSAQFAQNEKVARDAWWSARQQEQDYINRETTMNTVMNNATPQRQNYTIAQNNTKFKEVDIKKLRDKIKKAQTAGNMALATQLTNQLTNENALLEQYKSTEKQMKEVYDAAMYDYYKLNAEKEAEIQSFASERKKELIKITGGQEEVKDEYGNVIKKTVKSRGGEYLAMGAERLAGDKDKGTEGLWRTKRLESGFLGNTRLFTKNKETARQLREMSGKIKK